MEAPTAIELKNCRGYANRTYGLMDNTAAVTFSYCHFYANNLATGVSTDMTGTPGPIDGGHNLAADTPPLRARIHALSGADQCYL